MIVAMSSLWKCNKELSHSAPSPAATWESDAVIKKMLNYENVNAFMERSAGVGERPTLFCTPFVLFDFFLKP